MLDGVTPVWLPIRSFTRTAASARSSFRVYPPVKLPKPCLSCGDLTTNASKCDACGSTTARGYGASWQRLSAQVIAEEGCCRDCGHRGSRGNPLTCDHIVPKASGGTDDRSNLCCRCRRHNSAKGARPNVV